MNQSEWSRIERKGMAILGFFAIIEIWIGYLFFSLYLTEAIYGFIYGIGVVGTVILTCIFGSILVFDHEEAKA